MVQKSVKRKAASRFVVLALIIILAFVGSFVLLTSHKHAEAACTGSGAYGVDTMSVNVSSAGTYYIWTRMMIPSASADTILLEVDGGNCYSVGGNSSMAANTWTWVDYQNGATATPISLSLSAGTHTFKYISNQGGGIGVDNMLLSTQTPAQCTPTGTGTNCEPTLSNPTISLSATPTTVTQGKSVALSATVSDTVPITSVEFIDDFTPLTTDTTAPYSYTWNTNSSTPTGNNVITAIVTASDGATASTTVNVAVNALSTPTVSLSASPTTVNQGSTVNLTATASDSTSTITNVQFFDGSTLLSTDTTSPYSFNWATTTSTTTGTHSIKAVVNAADGATATSSTVNVTVNTAPKPTVSITATPTTVTQGSSVSLSATATDTAPITSVEFVDGLTPLTTDTTAPYSYTWNTTTSTPTGAHTITAIVTDNTGATASAATTVTVNAVPKPSAPTNLNATANSATSVSLSWTAATDTGGPGIGGYYVLRNGVNITPSGVAGTSYTDNTVSANTTYSYTVEAFDKSTPVNVSSPSTAKSVTTPNPPDTTPPTQPTNLRATAVSSSQIDLTWTASTDNVGVKNYEVFRNGNLVATVTTTSYGDTGLAASTTYSYTVKAFDGAGNASTASTAASATTQAATTNNPPTVSITSLSDNQSVHGKTTTVSASVTDNSGGTIVSAQLSVDGTAVQTLSSAPFNFSLDALNYKDGTYTLTVSSTDDTGLTGSQSLTINVTNGDLNSDNQVNILDLSSMAANWGGSGKTYAQGDINGDGNVNIQDLSIMAANWGYQTP